MKLQNILSYRKIPASQTYYKVSNIIKTLPKILIGNFNNSDKVLEFEQQFAKYCGAKKSCALPSARIALYYLLKNLKFPENSEILMTSITIADIVNMILCNNLRPRFVDMDIKTLNFSIEALEKNISKNTRAILITYLYGFIPENLDRVIEFAKKNKLIIIEDFSQALGAQYKNKKIGTLGDFGIYSCSSFKTLSALFGGMLISDNIEILEKIKMQAREELQKPKRLPFLVISLKILLHKFLNLPIVYSYFTFYFYSVLNSISPRLLYIIQTGNIGVLLGFKKVERYAKIKKELLFYFTDFQAELGLNNLKELNDINNKLCLIFQELKKIEGITKYFPNENSDTQNVYWRIPLFTHSQIQAMQYFLDCNIETSLSALPLCSAEECFKEFAIYDCKTAEKIYNHYLLLPTFAEMSAEQLKHLKKSLEFFLKNYEK